MSKKLLAVLVFALLAPASSWAGKITGIDFKYAEGSSTVVITSDGPLDYDKQENVEDKQVVLDFKGATLDKKASRIYDTSQFNSRVSLISPYSVDNDSRIVIQLRDMVAAEVSKNGNSLIVKFANPSGGAEQADAAPEPPGEELEKVATKKPKKAAVAEEEDDAAEAPAEEEIMAEEETTNPGAEVVVESTKSRPRKENRYSRSVQDQLDRFLQARENKRFIGRPITLQVRNADIVDIFRLIGEASGFNILIGDGVGGNITLSMTDVPWDQALDVILRTKRLGAERTNNLLRIVTLANLTQEKQEELRAKQAAESNAPRITRIFPISYATLGDVQSLLSKFITSSTVAGGPGAPGAPVSTASPTNTALVTTDARTNSLIVRDTPENIERIRKLIDVLDTQTPQILIEGKVVEANETFAKNLTGNLGLSGKAFNGGSGTANAFAAFNAGTTGAFAIPTTGATGSGSFGISPYTGFLPGLDRINAAISVGETELKAKVISSPRAVVLNKESASITQSTPVAITSTSTTGSTTTTSTTFVAANLTLTVQPTVTNDSGVLLQVSLSRDVPQGQGVSSRNVQTKVIVPSGNTLVLGGIYTAQSVNQAGGMPFFRKIPILGALFGDDSTSTQRAELLFFVSPRILNSSAAGLSSGDS